jgi:hypothetical protein
MLSAAARRVFAREIVAQAYARNSQRNQTEATHERVSVSSSDQGAERRDSHHRTAKLRGEKKPGALVA